MQDDRRNGLSRLLSRSFELSPLLAWPHGSQGDAKHRPETRAGQRKRCQEVALLTMRV
jgi:hypothetical protein